MFSGRLPKSKNVCFRLHIVIILKYVYIYPPYVISIFTAKKGVTKSQSNKPTSQVLR